MHESRKDYEGHKADWAPEKMESWNGKIRTVKCFRGLQSKGRCNVRIKIMTGKGNEGRNQDFGHLISACNKSEISGQESKSFAVFCSPCPQPGALISEYFMYSCVELFC